jgi:hypothetical protein
LLFYTLLSDAGTVVLKAKDIANFVKKTKVIQGMIPKNTIKFGAVGIGALVPLTIIICKAIAIPFHRTLGRKYFMSLRDQKPETIQPLSIYKGRKFVDSKSP